MVFKTLSVTDSVVTRESYNYPDHVDFIYCVVNGILIIDGASIGVDLARILEDAWRALKVGRCRVRWNVGRGVSFPAD